MEQLQHNNTPVEHAGLHNIPAATQPYQCDATVCNFQVIRRDGQRTDFDAGKINVALSKAFLAVEGGGAANSRRVHDSVARLTEQVVDAVLRHLPEGGTTHIEAIQDQVELALMRADQYKVARAYVLYREQQARLRDQQQPIELVAAAPLQVKYLDGSQRALDVAHLRLLIEAACAGLADADAERVLNDSLRHLYDGITSADVDANLVLAARCLIEHEPEYSQVAARLLLASLREVALCKLGLPATRRQAVMIDDYPGYFSAYIECAAQLQLLDTELTRYDLRRLGEALKPERDMQFSYLGLQTLCDRYFIHHQGTRFELPQAFFMRVAMGLAINEIDRETRAIEFYELLSSFDFMCSTPTLFNAGTLRPQLSSCYLTTVPDDLGGIYSAIKDNALLSKYAGGLGNDWTPVRGMGAHIKGTNGSSQGVVPFLKVANDTAVAVNQGGKRKGAVCAYLETWHIDIEEFLELRKNTGDERRRTHDMNTANWIPDLFMQRIIEEGGWSLFSPDETPDLHELVGTAFAERYQHYEACAQRGELRIHKRLRAVELWRKMLGMLFETGHPWIAFKDPCNLRSPQQHQGVVHSSNLCTEITLNTSSDEIAVCNLGSINLAQHINAAGLDLAKLERTTRTAMRMLDNVIDYNYYSVPQARRSNLRHRPVGLGLMGFQDALYQQKIAYASEAAVEFADTSMEAISYYAIQSSTELAEERGVYTSFAGSLWSQGILPIDSLECLAQTRGEYLDVNRGNCLDWDSLRERVKRVGMRNSNVLAIAPTATIANICGVTQSIEPTYQNLFVKSNLSGEFTVVNPYLVRDLKVLKIWDSVTVNDLKYYDGSIAAAQRVPDSLKRLYATAFEIDPRWLIEAAARRQKWIDQAQSLNLYMVEPSGKKLDALYKLAWLRGLKTTYYLRTLGATHAEKHSVDQHQLRGDAESGNACSLLDADCEACQ